MASLSIQDGARLSNGTRIPVVGFGTYEATKEAIVAAVQAGYRHFDTAPVYNTEVFVGEAIRESGIPREQFFVTTKMHWEAHGYENCLAGFEESMQKLDLGYVDLYLIHYPGKDLFDTETVQTDLRADSWRAVEEIYRSGRAKAVGISNYYDPHVREVIASCEIVPHVNQVCQDCLVDKFHSFASMHVLQFELNPQIQKRDLVALCREHNIFPESYSALGNKTLLTDPTIVALATKLNRTASQVLVRWVIQMGSVALPKSNDPAHIAENCDVFDFEISEEDMETLYAMEKDQRVWVNPTDIK